MQKTADFARGAPSVRVNPSTPRPDPSTLMVLVDPHQDNLVDSNC